MKRMKRRIISICCILSAFILFTAMNVFAEENSQSEILYSKTESNGGYT